MASMIRVTGVNKILSRLRAVTAAKAVNVGTRLKKAGLYVQRESQKIVPVDTAALKNTARTDSKGTGSNTDVIVHYGAGVEYAVYVHEDMNAKHKQGKRAKYLEAIIREKKKEIFNIIARG